MTSIRTFRPNPSHSEAPLFCDICGRENRPLIRFGLMVAGRDAAGVRTTRSAGGIDLCSQCHRGLRLRSRPRRRLTLAEAAAIRNDAAAGLTIQELVARHRRGFGTIQRLLAVA